MPTFQQGCAPTGLCSLRVRASNLYTDYAGHTRCICRLLITLDKMIRAVNPLFATLLGIVLLNPHTGDPFPLGPNEGRVRAWCQVVVPPSWLLEDATQAGLPYFSVELADEVQGFPFYMG